MIEEWKARLREWLRARDLELLASFLLLSLLVLAFARLTDWVGEDALTVDERILLAMREPDDVRVGLGGWKVENAARDVTALGSGTLIVLFVGALVGYFVLVQRPGAAIFVVAAVAGSWLLNGALKDVFERERPTVVPHLMSVGRASYPSGHAMISATLYPVLAELFGRLATRRRARVYLMVLGITAALLVGVSRVYLGVHYPTDVLGGLCLGFGWALLCGIVARVLQKHGYFGGEPDEFPQPSA